MLPKWVEGGQMAFEKENINSHNIVTKQVWSFLIFQWEDSCKSGPQKIDF